MNKNDLKHIQPRCN